MEVELLRFLLGQPVQFSPLRVIRYGAESGSAIGSALGNESARLRAEGIYAPFQADLASEEILRYESSALGSSRII